MDDKWTTTNPYVNGLLLNAKNQEPHFGTSAYKELVSMSKGVPYQPNDILLTDEKVLGVIKEAVTEFAGLYST